MFTEASAASLVVVNWLWARLVARCDNNVSLCLGFSRKDIAATLRASASIVI